jgi:hypothetical protein
MFIVPNSFLYNKSCSKVKNFLIENKYLEYVIDFKDKKIFEGFSVYTCILVINKKHSETRDFYYYSNDIKNEYIKKSYKPLVINNSLLQYINVKNGLATLADSVFIINKSVIKNEDNIYITFEKNNKNYKVEKTILQEVLKVSKNRVDYIITPYLNGKILENLEEYPECQNYLLDFKTHLENRDKGKKTYEKWYAFGRKQGLTVLNEHRLFISSLVCNIENSLIDTKSPLFYSGLWLEIKDPDKLTKENLIKILKENESIILDNSNVKSNGWYFLNKTSFNIEVHGV